MQVKKCTIIISIHLLFLSTIVHRDASAADTLFHWNKSNPESQGMSSARLNDMMQTLQSKGTKKLLIIKNDYIVCEWFAEGWHDSLRTHYSASLAKALVGGLSLLIALQDELLFPDMPVCQLVPEWKKDPQKSKITIRHLATHTSGLDDAEVKREIQNQMREQGLHTHMDLPGWKGQFWRKDPDPFSVSRDSAAVLFPPGSHFNYSNPGIGMLTYAVTAALGNRQYKDIRSLLWRQIYEPLGILPQEISIGYGKTYRVNNLELVPSWGGGAFTANAAARLGRLMLHKGRWQGVTLLDSAWVERVTTYANTAIPGRDLTKVSEESSIRTKNNPYPATTLGWYSNFDGVWEHVPRDAFAGAGAGHQLLLVVPSLDLFVVRFGSDMSDKAKDEGFWLGAEKYLFHPLMDAIVEAPYPQSDLIQSCTFAPRSEIFRLAEGSDNWPITWASDGDLYTAFGDGWGFEPKTDIKLSLGLAKIIGSPPEIKGQNIRTRSGERVGQGKYGPKASGLLCVDGILYMLVRNAGNARLAWSRDLGETWRWTDWIFDVSFGCPTFLNFGQDYAHARDNFVYIYSHDESTAYKISDRMVLARVTKEKILDWRAYEYYTGCNSAGQPMWSLDIRRRAAVFVNPGKCYRSSISYNPGLGRYLWCQIIPPAKDEQGPRFFGGLGVFEAPEPWGPWKTVYYTREWDVGPGESGSLPVIWMSRDGKTCHYVFSGDDCFSVRKLQFDVKEQK